MGVEEGPMTGGNKTQGCGRGFLELSFLLQFHTYTRLELGTSYSTLSG